MPMRCRCSEDRHFGAFPLTSIDGDEQRQYYLFSFQSLLISSLNDPVLHASLHTKQFMQFGEFVPKVLGLTTQTPIGHDCVHFPQFVQLLE